MGVLEDSDGKRHTLGNELVLGRNPDCHVFVDDLKVSSRHASLRWTGDHWEIRDLGSTNGIWIGKQRLPKGASAPLAEGATFALGNRARPFTLVDTSPPMARARHVGTGAIRAAQKGLLVLPDDDQPLFTVLEDSSGRWVIESEQARRTANDRETIHVAGEAWVLELPSAVGTTQLGSREMDPILETIDLRLAVSRNEESFEVRVIHHGETTLLPPRAFHYLLVILARARLADTESSSAERGWMDRDEVCRMLRYDTNRLNVEIFRLRKQLSDELGVQGISGLVARRQGTGQIRLGIDRVEVTQL